MSSPPDGRRGSGLVLGAAVLWGTTGTAQALGPEGADPLAVGAVRLVVGGVALALLAAVTGSFRFDRRPPLPSLGFTVAGIAAYQPLFFTGVRQAGVALGTVVAIGTAPVLAGILARIVDGQQPSPRWVSATIVGVAGVALIAGGGGTSGMAGILPALGSALAYAVYATGSKRLVGALNPLGAMGVAFGGGALVLAPLAARLDTSWLHAPAGLAMEAWLGLGATALAYVLFAHGLATTPVATAATLSLAEPLTATLLGVAVLGERPGARAWAGAALVVAGLVLAVERR